MPESIHVYLSRILDMTRRFYQAKYVCDGDRQLTEVIEHSVQVRRAQDSGPNHVGAGD